MSLAIYQEGDSVVLLHEDDLLKPHTFLKDDIKRYGQKLGFNEQTLTIEEIQDESGEQTGYVLVKGEGALAKQTEEGLGPVFLDKKALSSEEVDLPSFVKKYIKNG